MKSLIFASTKRPKELTEVEASAQVDKWISIKDATDKTATIEIDGEIGDDFWGEGSNTVKAIKGKLKDIAALKTQKIIVNINSLGGSVAHGLGIHDVLAHHTAEIETNVQGMTASSATIIAQAGDVRKMSDNALYLIHQPWGMFMSNVTELEQDLEDMNTINDRLVNIYVKRSKQTEKTIRDLMSESNGNGKWIDAYEAIEMGLIDEVYEPMKAAAMVVPLNARYYMKLPDLPQAKEKVNEDNTQIFNIMKDLKEMFAGLKTFITASFKKEGEENSIPEDIQSKMNEVEAQITEMENKDDKISDLEASVETEKGEKETAITDLSTANETIGTRDATIKGLETDLAKAKGLSTKIEGKTAGEDADNPADKKAAMLAKDLEIIKGELPI